LRGEEGGGEQGGDKGAEGGGTREWEWGGRGIYIPDIAWGVKLGGRAPLVGESAPSTAGVTSSLVVWKKGSGGF
jgi:hypothetical protein